jgi:hypothetical protein
MTRRELTRLAANQSFILVPCIYENVAHLEIISEIVKSTISQLRSSIRQGRLNSPPWDESLLVHSATYELTTKIRIVGSLLKDQGFSVENEHRLIYTPPRPFMSPTFEYVHPPKHFRASPMGVTSSTLFRLRDEADNTIQSLKLVLGPSIEREASLLTLREFLKSVEVHANPEASNIPYRPTS